MLSTALCTCCALAWVSRAFSSPAELVLEALHELRFVVADDLVGRVQVVLQQSRSSPRRSA